MASITTAHARIATLDATHWDSEGYVPEAAPYPFQAVPASHAAGKAQRASSRRAKRLGVCATCFVASCDEH